MFKPITQPAVAGCQPAVPCRPAVPQCAAPAQAAPQQTATYSSTLAKMFANLVWLR